MISNLFDLYKEHLRTTTSERTLEMRSEKTLLEFDYARRWYLKIFDDHMIDSFPEGVRKDFKVKLSAEKISGNSARVETVAPMTVRKYGIQLNSSFAWMSERGFITGPSIKLQLPSKSMKPAVRTWTEQSRRKIEDRIRKMYSEASM